MFDVGFWELIFIGIITLLIAGPERMPRIARTAGLWLGKMRGVVSSVKQEIDREIAADELRNALKKQAGAPELQELIDEVSGKPLQAVEHPPKVESDMKQPAGDDPDSAASRTSDDQKN